MTEFLFDVGQIVTYKHSMETPTRDSVHVNDMAIYSNQQGVILQRQNHWKGQRIYNIKFPNGKTWWCKEMSLVRKYYKITIRRKGGNDGS